MNGEKVNAMTIQLLNGNFLHLFIIYLLTYLYALIESFCAILRLFPQSQLAF